MNKKWKFQADVLAVKHLYSLYKGAYAQVYYRLQFFGDLFVLQKGYLYPVNLTSISTPLYVFDHLLLDLVLNFTSIVRPWAICGIPNLSFLILQMGSLLTHIPSSVTRFTLEHTYDLYPPFSFLQIFKSSCLFWFDFAYPSVCSLILSTHSLSLYGQAHVKIWLNGTSFCGSIKKVTHSGQNQSMIFSFSTSS